jgi:hypothetical protein
VNVHHGGSSSDSSSSVSSHEDSEVEYRNLGRLRRSRLGSAGYDGSTNVESFDARTGDGGVEGSNAADATTCQRYSARVTKDLRGTVLTFRCVEGPASGIDIGGGNDDDSPLALLVPDLADPPLFSLLCGWLDMVCDRVPITYPIRL